MVGKTENQKFFPTLMVCQVQHTIKLTHDWVFDITFDHDISVHVCVSVFACVCDDITHTFA